MPQWKEHRPSILRPKFAKNLELGFLFCLVLFCLNQTTTSFKSFTRSNYSVPKHQTCTAHGLHGGGRKITPDDFYREGIIFWFVAPFLVPSFLLCFFLYKHCNSIWD